jgi:hypothetical protein
MVTSALGEKMTVDDRMYRNGQFNQDRHIECARWNNLVYARTLKCGSEFFYKNFVFTAGWQPTLWPDIDWQTDRVFSYIMDPIQRRHKGIAEYLFINDAMHLLDDPAFSRIIAQAPFLDEHSASMRTVYGDRVNDIHWIPMSQTDHEQAQRLTDQLLWEYEHPKIQWNRDYVHTTENYMGPAYRTLRALWEKDPWAGITRFYFQEDIERYIAAQRNKGIIDG